MTNYKFEEDYLYDKDYKFSAKWGEEASKHGFTQIPNVMIHCQKHLGLKDGELAILCHLLSYWFSEEGEVFPSIETLAHRSGKAYSTIQKRLCGLETKGFIKRNKRQGTSNEYDLKECTKKVAHHLSSCLDPPRKRYLDWQKVIGIHPSKRKY